MTPKMTDSKTPTIRHKSFGSRKLKGSTPLTFDLLEGKYTFTAKSRIQGALLLDFVAQTEDGGAAAAAHLTDFISAVLKTDEDRELFSSVIHSDDEDDTIEIEDLADIVSWLVEEYSQRPTQES
jgi:hypothetical protein